jgi:ribose transport system permease protein
VVGIGTNEEAMRLAGVDPRPIRIIVFAATGLLAGLAGLMQSARLEAADPNAGVGIELQVIAAVVIGGTSLMGGRGSVINTFFGVLIIAVLEAGLAQVGASEPSKRIDSIPPHQEQEKPWPPSRTSHSRRMCPSPPCRTWSTTRAT